MVGTGANDSNIDPVFFVPPSVPINNVDAVPSVQIVDCPLSIDFPDLLLTVSLGLSSSVVGASVRAKTWSTTESM